MKPLVSIIMGSVSDLPFMTETKMILDEFKVPYETMVLSAHRSPRATSGYTKKLRGRGVKVIIAGAGGAAHLPGVVASYTILPVIGVPVFTRVFRGLDSALSILQMPGGITVATMAVGKGGAVNAAILAVEILALGNRRLAGKLEVYKKLLVKKVKAAQKKINGS